MTTARIMVVEDEPIVARDIAVQLSLLGYTPTGHATRGEEAIAMASELRPDLILMDVQLRGDMDGITAAGAIREQTMLPVWTRATSSPPGGNARNAQATERW